MYNRHKFVTGMAAGMALQRRSAFCSPNRRRRWARKFFKKHPSGRTIKHLGTMIQRDDVKISNKPYTERLCIGLSL